MKFYPEVEKIKEIASLGKYDIAPVAIDVFSDMLTPICGVMNLKSISKHVFMLELMIMRQS